MKRIVTALLILALIPVGCTEAIFDAVWDTLLYGEGEDEPDCTTTKNPAEIYKTSRVIDWDRLQYEFVDGAGAPRISVTLDLDRYVCAEWDVTMKFKAKVHAHDEVMMHSVNFGYQIQTCIDDEDTWGDVKYLDESYSLVVNPIDAEHYTTIQVPKGCDEPDLGRVRSVIHAILYLDGVNDEKSAQAIFRQVIEFLHVEMEYTY